MGILVFQCPHATYITNFTKMPQERETGGSESKGAARHLPAPLGEAGPAAPWNPAWGGWQTSGEAAEFWSVALFCGRTMGGGEQGSSLIHPKLCRGEGGISDSGNWSTRVRADVGHDSWAISPVDLNDSSESTGDVLAGEGGVDHASGQGGSREEGGGDAARGGYEEGEESAVDGVIGWARVG